MIKPFILFSVTESACFDLRRRMENGQKKVSTCSQISHSADIFKFWLVHVAIL